MGFFWLPGFKFKKNRFRVVVGGGFIGKIAVFVCLAGKFFSPEALVFGHFVRHLADFAKFLIFSLLQGVASEKPRGF